MGLNTPEERIAAAVWPPENPDFRDICNTIRLQVQREMEHAQLEAFRFLMTKEAHDRGSVLLLRDLVLAKQKSVDEYDARIRILEANKSKLRPIR